MACLAAGFSPSSASTGHVAIPLRRLLYIDHITIGDIAYGLDRRTGPLKSDQVSLARGSLREDIKKIQH